MGERAAALVGEVQLGDARLNQRLELLVEQMLDHPQMSIPEACGSWAATIGAYRFLENDRVSPEAIMAGVAQGTVARCPRGGVLLAVQDTTSIDYTAHRSTEGLGPLESSRRRGLVMHSTLAVTPDGTPVGLLDQQLWARDPETLGKSEQRAEVPIEGKESAKWLRSIRTVLERTEDRRCQVVTVADREADVYEVFALAAELESEWVIRARHDRCLADGTGRVEAAVAAAPVRATREIQVARQVNHPERTATVEIRALPVRLSPPQETGKLAKAKWRRAHPDVPPVGPTAMGALPFGVVLVTEPHPPTAPETKPVRWLLVTSLPITSVEEVLTCLHYYRLRWLVERFHFILKSGCQVEKLQLEQTSRLKRALTIYSVVAVWLLGATYLARTMPEAPATIILDEAAWRVLLTVTHPHQPLPLEPPTIHEAIRLIARLGGFLARTGDGEPGAKTIWRGFRRLSDMELAYRMFTTVTTAPTP